jgi:hemerythrin
MASIKSTGPFTEPNSKFGCVQKSAWGRRIRPAAKAGSENIGYSAKASLGQQLHLTSSSRISFNDLGIIRVESCSRHQYVLMHYNESPNNKSVHLIVQTPNPSPNKTPQWADEFSLGIPAIDRQHRKIFELLLKIENSIEQKEAWNVVRFQLADLIEYMRFHLAVEESLLEIMGYPDLDAHCKTHEKLNILLIGLEEGMQNSQSAENLVAFFQGWFVNHVLGDDKNYAGFVLAITAGFRA